MSERRCTCSVIQYRNNAVDDSRDSRIIGKGGCPKCHGVGIVKTCDKCDGAGMIPDSQLCQKCNGHGVVAGMPRHWKTEKL